jgi:hypothetical protein
MVAATEQHYSVQQVAEMWSVGEATVRRIFEDQPGFLKISMPQLVRNRKHRPHVLLRIPASVLARVHEDRSRGFGLEVQPRRGRVK